MLNDNDEWVDVQGFECRYQVAADGRVRSIQDNHGNYREHPLAQSKTGTVDYLYVKLFIKDKMFNRAVHRLVAAAFCARPEGTTMVNHLDGNKRNNAACNLEWTTCSGNHKHAFQLGLRNADHVAARQRGVKFGVGSKYHNVSWDSTRQKWKASMKDKGVSLFQKRFDAEADAAMYVNAMLDHFGISDRPRNVIV